MRLGLLVVALAALGLLMPTTAESQSFGIGGRIAMVRGDVDSDTDAERFSGGHIRLRPSPRTGLEVSLDTRTETNDAETERIRELPLQASLLLFPVSSAFAPYVLGGGGWYTTRSQVLEDGEWTTDESTRTFGWHGGFGAEMRLGRHAALHADYRYTYLSFNDDDEEEESAVSRLIPSYKGSMWTAGLTIYF
jgi:opacity protein-like surface antigen